MTALLPPNSTLLERALEQATTRIEDILTNLRALWSPDDCPEPFLPWLAWALSLDSWSPDWPIEVKRERVRRALEIARKKGTAESVRSVVASFGGSVAIREWWQKDTPSVPHTFDLVLTLSAAAMAGQPVTAAYVDAIVAEVRRAKPVRSHFTFTQGIAGAADVGVIAVARPFIYARLHGSASAA